MVGTLACLVAVVPRGAAEALARNLHVMLGFALALLTLSSFGILLSRTLELNGGTWSTLWHDMRLALTVTHFGHVWWWRVPALALLWLGWVVRMRHAGARWMAWPMLLAVGVIALTRSETGHPADHGDFTLSVWIDWLHLLAAGAWVGSLLGMAWAVFPRLLRAEGKPPREAARIFQRLSTLCGVALAVLVACGIYSAVQQLGSVNGLWTTRYGITLDVKLALVLAMILIGAHNRYVKLPRLLACAGLPGGSSALTERWQPRNAGAPRPAATGVLRACARAVLVESLLGIAVIGATGALLHAMPPADARPMHELHASSSANAMIATPTRAAPAQQAVAWAAARQGFEVGPGAAR